MKKYLLIFSSLLVYAWGMSAQTMKVRVSNPAKFDRTEEMVELKWQMVKEKLKLADGETFVLTDDKGNEQPYQITYDGKVIFNVQLRAKAKSRFLLKKGKPSSFTTWAVGRQYPERLDDMAWENDKGGYRAYGPTLQSNGERGFGYDLFTKKVPEPILEELYANELNPEIRKRIGELRAKGLKEEAEQLERPISYHIDHGKGMDCYAVGPTLGGGAAALIKLPRCSQIDAVFNETNWVMPWCYQTYRILDNGPLRFTVELTFGPTPFGSTHTVVEHRLIQLDKGSFLNKTTLRYEGLSDAFVVVGISKHNDDTSLTKFNNSMKDIIAYADPTTNPNGENGTIFVGAIVENSVRKDSGKHLAAVTYYDTRKEFVYYWGQGWSKGFMPDGKSWVEYLKTYYRQLQKPLRVKY